MPSITFVLPHWLYWSGLVFIPLLAMFMVRRVKKAGGRDEPSIPIAYMFWLSAGFVGIHRFYVKNIWGVVYIPLFIAILLGNVQVREAMNLVSEAKNNVSIADFDLERAETAISEGEENAVQKRDQALKALETARAALAVENEGSSYWNWVSRILAGATALLLLVDAFLLPRLIRRCASREAEEAEPDETEAGDAKPAKTRGGFFGWIDRINGYIGEFVCYWSIIAVFVYYYEVVTRYVFNSPTNWAHESMFLMFGMQYMMAGAYTFREDGHVRVDVLYQYFSRRAKALVSVFTSIFFFIFTIALLWSGWIFMMDSVSVWEVSFTEWAIQYWPVKIAIPLGALMLALQGLSKLVTDFGVLIGKKA